MCGIAGCSDPGADLRLDSLAHRGPDGAAAWTDGAFRLGFRRLAILDREGGMQPFHSEDDRYHLVLNGEIYNHHALRRELEGLGHRFRSRCDAEVALHGWEAWGEGVLGRLRGMFAFAIWDSRDRVLSAARDRRGEKPLVYFAGGGRLAFASELAALEAPRRIDRDALGLYLERGYVPAPYTMIEGVRTLPPGHLLRWTTSSLDVRPWAPGPPEAEDLPFEEAARRVREAVTASVDARLEAEVPLGAFLSGGLDSSILVGLMARRGPVKTYSIGFEDPALDESAHAEAVARAFTTQHRTIRFDAPDPSIGRHLATHFGAPFADSAAIPTWTLAQGASREVRVALSGEGADEAFAGYARHRALRLLAKLKRLPAPLRWAARLLPVDRKYRTRTRDLLDRLDLPLGSLYLEMLAPIDRAARARLLPGEDPRLDAPEDPVRFATGHDFGNYLPGDLLAKTDTCSMAHGLEVRCPYLAEEVVDLAFRIPSAHKIRGRVQKAVLRHAFRDLLPPEIAARGKQGFAVPMDAWLRGPLKARRDELLRGGPIRSLLAAPEIDRLLSEHDAGVDRSRALWTLAMLAEWMAAFRVQA